MDRASGGEITLPRAGYDIMPPRVQRAWEYYRSLPYSERSLERTSTDLGIPRRTVQRWCGRYHWVEATAEWELSEARTRDEEMRRRQMEVEEQLYQHGRALHEQAVALLRMQMAAGRVQIAAVQAVAETRAELLRGLRLPERITRQETTGDGGGPIQMEVHHDGDVSLDWDGFQRALWELVAARPPALPGVDGADDNTQPLDSAHADGAADALPDAAGG